MHGHVLRANIVPISLFLNVPHDFGDVGRPEYMEDPGSDLSSKGEPFRPHQKRTDVPSGLLQSSIVTTQVSLSLMGTSDVRNGCPDRVRIYSSGGISPNPLMEHMAVCSRRVWVRGRLSGNPGGGAYWSMNTNLRVNYSSHSIKPTRFSNI